MLADKAEKKIHRVPTNIRHLSVLLLVDMLLLLVMDVLMLKAYPSSLSPVTATGFWLQFLVGAVSIFPVRIIGRLYHHVWRYGRTALYLRLMVLDMVGGVVYLVLDSFLPVEHITAIRKLVIVALNLLATMSTRFLYQFSYEYEWLHGRSGGHPLMNLLSGIMRSMGGAQSPRMPYRVGIAIVGAGRVGVMLAEELQRNPNAHYLPKCFIDIDRDKIGRSINGIPVFSEEEGREDALDRLGVQEIVFALPQMDAGRKQQLFDLYQKTGCRLKIYDYPTAMAVEKGKRQVRDFAIEELLTRSAVDMLDDSARACYRGQTVLITGGGGSIGSELCRQIARISPKALVIVDVYENGAYDIQQELHIAYGNSLAVHVEILSVCDVEALRRVFMKYRPDIVLHAAAHKHVPLMEHNCLEAVKNNVMGTLNTVEAAEEAGVGKFIMISTDKAVNPTNVMGATKRMCEMIVQSRQGNTVFSCTRFGNVLGSNGSVVPLFKRQISNGGPVTITDRRIIRYFMTIPEASQLVLQSGVMARNGELFVLDMGKPVRILELAESMIRLSGMVPYEDIQIVETGLRPGEKLYEELLIQQESLTKTENELIFIERDAPLTPEAVAEKIDSLRAAVATGEEGKVKAALMAAVPSYRAPEEVNRTAAQAREFSQVDG